MTIRILVVDDHPVVRAGIRFMTEQSAPDIEIVGEAGDGREALALAETCQPDVVLMDIAMPEMNGIEALRRLVARNPDARVIVLSHHTSSTFVREALEAGAKGYMVKESAMEDVVSAVRQVHAGNSFLSPCVSGMVVDGYVGGAPAGEATGSNLTSREREILQLIAEGMTSREIGATIGVSANTVRVHRTNLMAKLNIHKGADLVRYAVREGIANL